MITIRSEQAFFECLILWIIIRGLVLLNKRKCIRVSLKRELLLNLFAIYVIALISVTLFPINVIWGRRGHPLLNIVPFVEIITRFPHIMVSETLVRDYGGNLLLLLPLGIFLPSLWSGMRSFRNIVIIGFLTSLSIESLQYVMAYFGCAWGRATDVDDLILNTLGIMIGYLVFAKLLVRFDFRFKPGKV